MQSEKTKGKKKRVYEIPRLRTIELAAEEVLGVGCKTISGPGPTPPTCTSSFCSALGS